MQYPTIQIINKNHGEIYNTINAYSDLYQDIILPYSIFEKDTLKILAWNKDGNNIRLRFDIYSNLNDIRAPNSRLFFKMDTLSNLKYNIDISNTIINFLYIENVGVYITLGFAPPEQDLLVIKFDIDGNLIWYNILNDELTGSTQLSYENGKLAVYLYNNQEKRLRIIDDQGNLEQNKILFSETEFEEFTLNNMLKLNKPGYHAFYGHKSQRELAIVITDDNWNVVETLSWNYLSKSNYGISSLIEKENGNLVAVRYLSNEISVFLTEISPNYITSVNESKYGSNILISPMPVYDILEINSDIEINQTIEIFSIEGIKLLETEFANKVNVSNLTTGVYILKIGNHTTKFVKL